MLLKSEVPVPEEAPPLIPDGSDVVIIDCAYSCVRIGGPGVVESHMPGKGYAVKVKTVHTGLFGGSYSGEGTYFFEYGQIIESHNEPSSIDTSGAS
jgi:hypothetical protein